MAVYVILNSVNMPELFQFVGNKYLYKNDMVKMLACIEEMHYDVVQPEEYSYCITLTNF